MFAKIIENWWKWGVWEAPIGTWGASWSQDDAQERQEEPQEAPRQPTWRQDGPTWLQDGVPNLLQNHENSIEKILFFGVAFLMEFWRDLGAKIDEKSSPKSKKTWLQTRWAKTMKMCTALMRKSHFWCFASSQIHQKSKKNRYQKHDFLGAGFEVDFS